MRITFIVPDLGLSGGLRVVFEYANRLHARGHQVVIVSPWEFSFYQRIPYHRPRTTWRLLRHRQYILKQARRFQRTSQDSNEGSPVSWFDVKAQAVRVPFLSNRYVPEGDIVVATLWATAEWVNTYPPQKGEKLYLVQGYETCFGPEERVDATWQMPLKKIVIASWLKELSEKKFGERAYGPIINGLNFQQFHNDHKVYHQPRRIGMLYHTDSWKGISDGLRAFDIARKKYPDIQLVMFGISPPGPEVSEDVEFHQNPPQDRLKDIYSSCDIFLSSSWVEGCQLPPMEAMACKCAVVATNVGGIPDYTIPGETALVAPPHQPEKLAEHLIALLDDENLLKRISMAGYEHIQQFTWDRATDQLERIFIEGCKPHGAS